MTLVARAAAPSGKPTLSPRQAIDRQWSQLGLSLYRSRAQSYGPLLRSSLPLTLPVSGRRLPDTEKVGSSLCRLETRGKPLVSCSGHGSSNAQVSCIPPGGATKVSFLHPHPSSPAKAQKPASGWVAAAPCAS